MDKLDIEQAEKLRELNLCVNSGYFIVSKKIKNKPLEYKLWWSDDITNYKFSKYGKYKLIGPLPNSDECWAVLIKILRESGEIPINKTHLEALKILAEIMENKFWFGYEQLSQTMRQAIINLKCG